MTAVEDWHISDHDLDRYAHQSISTFTRASVESHLLGCDRCRSALIGRSPAGADTRAQEMWAQIADRIDVSGRPLRSSTTALQVSTASPLLVLATLVVAVGVLVSVGIAATVAPRASLPLFVMLAPVAPLIGAVVAFQTGIDPAGQLAGATPLAAGRLPFFRAMLASGSALLAVAAASVFVSVGLSDVAIWLLPGLALTALVVAASTWVEPRRVALALGCVWALAVATWSWGPRSPSAQLDLADFAAERVPVQTALVAITLASIAITVVRRNELPAWRIR
ncbi:hypothetical protein [Ilumatobacter sp.]|uniref:hypothetical protein n=1 Tax=Ilumatobacter sp. TaxID=1967498 RepID=UPI003C5FC1F1